MRLDSDAAASGESSARGDSMLRDLPAARLERALELLPGRAHPGHLTFVHAVLERRMPGRVLVDDRDAPRTAFVLSPTGFHFAIGRPDPAAVESALPLLCAPAAGAERPALWASTRAWEAALDQLFAVRTTRKEFRRDARRRPRPGTLPAGVHLARLDRALALRIAASFDPWIVRIWGGEAGFARHSFGVAVLVSGEPLAFCAACAIGDGHAEVEIGTAPGQRRRGLAQAAAVAFFGECERRGLVPSWSCATANRASDRLARRLGFSLDRYVAGYPLAPGMTWRVGRWWLPGRRLRRRRRPRPSLI